MENEIQRKQRVVCLHGYSSRGEIFMKDIFSKWPETILNQLDVVFPDAPFPIDEEGDHFEWFHSSPDFKEITKFEECINYLEDFMLKHGPFDGVLGFSQGALLAAALPGIQRGGVALTKVPNIKFVILMAGGKFGGLVFGLPRLAANAFSYPIICPSLHIISENDPGWKNNEDLVSCFVDPVVIYHHEGHNVPRLLGDNLKMMLDFIKKIKKLTLEPEAIASLKWVLIVSTSTVLLVLLLLGFSWNNGM